MLSYYPTTMCTKTWTIRTLVFMMDIEVVNSWLLYKKDMRELGTARKNFMQLLDFKLELPIFCLPLTKGLPQLVVIVKPCHCVSQQLCHFRVRALGASHMPELVDQKSASRCQNPGCCERTKFRCCKSNLFLCLTAGHNFFKRFHKK